MLKKTTCCSLDFVFNAGQHYFYPSLVTFPNIFRSEIQLHAEAVRTQVVTLEVQIVALWAMLPPRPQNGQSAQMFVFLKANMTKYQPYKHSKGGAILCKRV